YPQTAVNRNMWVVATHSLDNGVGGVRTLSYQYRDGRVDLRGRGWLGFAGRTIADAQTGAVSTYAYDNQTRTGSLYLHAGMPSHESHTIRPTPDIVVRREVDVQSAVRDGTNPQSTFIYPSRVQEDVYEGPSSTPDVLLARSVQTQAQDAYGNVTSSS